MAVKLVFFIRRKPQLSRADFQSRYFEGHAQLVLDHFPRLRRYVVNLVQGEAPAEQAEEVKLGAADAIAEMWFDSLGDFADRARRYDSGDGAASVEASADALYDSVVAYQVEQHIQRDYERSWPDGQPSPGVKMVYPVRRKADLSRKQFVEHWLHKHVPIVLQYMNGISRYATNVLVRPLGNAPDIDGIVELHYLNPDDLKGPRYDAPEAEAIMAEDVAQFLTPSRIALRTTEYILRS
jgi:uncharacterized protein (TIGR02118 family)